MKLKLPLGLLTAVFACMNMAVADEITDTDTIPEGDTATEATPPTMVNDAVGYNSYHYMGANNTGTMCCYLTQEAEYTESHDYYDNKNATLLNVGALGKDGSLSVMGDGTEVNVGGHLYVGGRGYDQDVDVAPGSGYVFVGKGASLNVGAHPANYGTDLTQLHVGAPDGSSAEMVVEGTVTSRGMIIVDGGKSDATGKIRVQNGGRLALTVTDNIKTGTPQVVIGSNAGSNALIEVDNQSTFEITTTETRQADVATWIGSSGNGTLDVTNGSTANLATGYGSNIVYMGVQAGTTGAVDVDEGSNLTMGTAYVGYAGTGQLSAANDSVVTIKGDTYLGAGQSGKGTMSLSSGSETTVQGTTYLGYHYYTEASLNIDNASMTTGAVSESGERTGGDVIIGLWGSGEMIVSNGGSATVTGALIAGYAESGSGSVLVDGEGSKLTVDYFNTTIGKAVASSMSVRNGAVADLQYVAVGNGSTLNIENGGTVEAGWGMGITTDSTVTVKDGEGASSQLLVSGGDLLNLGTMKADLSNGGSIVVAKDAAPNGEAGSGELVNYGTIEMTLANNSSFEAAEVKNEVTGTMTVTVKNGGSYEVTTVTNSGTMDVELHEGATMKVGTYTNAGDSTITAAENTTCEIATLDLVGGSMKLDGEGSFDLGGETGLSSAFYVSGATTATHVDLSALTGTGSGKVNLTINADSVFTLNFTPDVLANIGEGDEQEFVLTLVVGNGDFSVDDDTLVALLDKVVYNFETAQVMALALDADVTEGSVDYVVANDEFRMEGNDLIWTGTVKHVPEPTTATLSLLALAALAARRRRK